MSKISADGMIVKEFTTQLQSSINQIEFRPTDKISHSDSPSTNELKSAMALFQDVVEQYKNCMNQEIQNVNAVHQAIRETDIRLSRMG